MQPLRRLVLVLVIAVPAFGCGGTSTAPTPPGATTETFTGTVAVGGRDIHPFTVAASGEVDVTLTAAGPPSTIFMGVAVGSYANSTCTLLSTGSVVQAGTIAQLTGVLDAGSYCVDVFDAGNQSANVDYSVLVSHY